MGEGREHFQFQNKAIVLPMNWEHILRDSVKENKIRELHLRNVPILKNCENWMDVKEIGTINHRTKYAQYKGLLVKYGDSLYYISDKKMEALKPFRSWNSRTQISVTEIQK